MEAIEQAEAIDLMIADIGLWPGAPHGVALGNMAQRRLNGLKIIYMSGTLDAQWAAATESLRRCYKSPSLPIS